MWEKGNTNDNRKYNECDPVNHIDFRLKTKVINRLEMKTSGAVDGRSDGLKHGHFAASVWRTWFTFMQIWR